MDEAGRDAIRQRLRDLLAPHDEILFAYLLGSFEQSLPFRDIDVALYLEPSFLQANDELQYSLRLTDELEQSLPYPIDVRVLNNAPCGFRYNATRGRLILCRDEALHREWLAETWEEYLDFAPALRHIGRGWVRKLCGDGATDEQVIIGRIGALRQNIERVRQIVTSHDEQSLINDAYKMAALKWHLTLAIEDVFSLCSRTIARLGGAAPTSYAECFKRAHELGIIDESLMERLRAMVRFRNLLIHRYWEVDDRRVIAIAQIALGDLEAFAVAVARHFGLTP
jgi:uncharacterized protein YutE (UPF0331/DUF86 family)/predicted nucleotidyltransferase